MVEKTKHPRLSCVEVKRGVVDYSPFRACEYRLVRSHLRNPQHVRNIASNDNCFAEYVANTIQIGTNHELFLTIGYGCEELAIQEPFRLIVSELVTNCTEKARPLYDIAKEGVLVNVDIAFYEGRFYVLIQDDVTYNNEDLEVIKKNLNKKKPVSLHKNVEKDLIKLSDKNCSGIQLIRNFLQSKQDGRLQYIITPEKRIAAMLSWKTCK